MAFGNATKGYVKKHSGGGGTIDYDELLNKPSINGVELLGENVIGTLSGQIHVSYNSLTDLPVTPTNTIEVINYIGDGVRQKIFNIGPHKAVKFLSDIPGGMAQTDLITRNTTKYITKYLENGNIREAVGTVTHTDTTISLQFNDAGLEYNEEDIPYIMIVIN